jgi:hypothetical protein
MARKQNTLPAVKKQSPAPAVQTERQKRAAMVPRFKDIGRLDCSPAQLEGMKDAMHTDHGLVLQGAVHAATAANPYKDEAGDRQRNVALRLLVELAPQNALERLLIQQLIATDAASSLCLGIGSNTENNPDARRKYMALACQFQGLQVRQIEALAKLRTGGRQHVTVEHVTVEAGGQAIVGAVTQGAGGGGDSGGR